MIWFLPAAEFFFHHLLLQVNSVLTCFYSLTHFNITEKKLSCFPLFKISCQRLGSTLSSLVNKHKWSVMPHVKSCCCVKKDQTLTFELVWHCSCCVSAEHQQTFLKGQCLFWSLTASNVKFVNRTCSHLLDAPSGFFFMYQDHTLQM